MSIGNQVTLTSNVASKVISVIATASQTVFIVQGGYRINQLSVYRSGVRLVDSIDYTARDGSSVTLFSPAALNDVLEFQVFDDFRAADAIVSSASNQTIVGNLNVNGTLTGTTIVVATATSAITAGTATTATNIPNLTGAITSNNTTTSLGSFSSANLAAALTDETGSGVAVFATSPTLVTPVLGNATATTLNVGNVVAAAGTFTNLTVNGTQTIINTTSLEVSDKNIGIGSTSSPSDVTADGAGITIYGNTEKTLTYSDTKKALETNIAWAPNENRFITGAEKTVLVSGNTATLTYNSSSANVAICINPTDNITLNVNGIPTSSDFDNHALTFTVITTATSGVARTCTAVNMNGVSKTIKWAGGSLAAAVSGLTTTSGYTIYGFTAINIVGSANSTVDYEVFGVVSGGFW